MSVVTDTNIMPAQNMEEALLNTRDILRKAQVGLNLFIVQLILAID